ncbi:hypothetical protein GGI14_003664 [Coemansia sp. S680]|nr:hypothetical protein GGI14_003664 [Coemansia sp. S680]
MASKLINLAKRKSSVADINPGEAFGPLSDDYKPGSTRARFEELASTYRNSNDTQGHALGMLDDAVQKRESLVQLIAKVKEGELPPTSDIVDLVHKMDFDSMREHATTFQGKKVIDNFENSTAAGIIAFENINGEENAQEIVRDLNNTRIKTKDDRKKLTKKTKQGAEESKSIVSSAGKDFLVLAGGIGTSAAFRKAITDLGSLISSTVQNKEPKEEDMEPLTNRVRDLVVEVRADRNVQRALASLSSLFTTTYNKSASAAKDVRDKAKGHAATEDLKDAKEHARDIFTRLGNGYDLTAMFAAISAIGAMYRDNEDFGKLADDTKEFGRWAMNVDADKLTSDEFETRSRELLEKGRHTLTEQDSEHFETVAGESKKFMKAVKANPVLVEYKDAMAGFAHSVVGHSDMTGEERREHYRALRQDFMANLPVIIQAIRYLPIPRVAGQNKELEFAADNIVLDLKRFVPQHISFDSHSDKHVMSAAVGAVKQGTLKSKERLGKLKSKSEETKEQAEDAAEKTKDKIQDVADMPKDEAKARVENKVEGIQNQVEDAAERTEDKIQDVADMPKDEAKARVENKAEGVKSQVEDQTQANLNKLAQQQDQRRDSLVEQV